MRRIGFVVNPIAGMGGRVGLKGTDGMVAEARERGAEPRAPDRGLRALEAIEDTGETVELLTWGGEMGAGLLDAAEIAGTVLGEPDTDETSATDTAAAVSSFIAADVDVILFVGGDGTAVDVAEAITDGGAEVPMLGVPAGVKIFSAVFAVTPEAAGEIAATFDRTEAREVADIDEEAYREGEVRSTVRAVVDVPVHEGVQTSKQLASGSIEGLIEGVVEDISPDTTYLLGPGGTVGSIKAALGFDGTPLGIDVWRDGEVIVRDAAEDALLEVLDDEPVIVVSPIGGQGFVFGRGNQQFSPEVIRASDLWIVASPAKADDLGVLRVDTGDRTLDEELSGWVKVRVGRFERRMMRIDC